MSLRGLFLLMLSTWLPLSVAASALPIPEQGPVLRIQGSNTIGAALGPALVEGLMKKQGLLKVHSEATDKPNESRIVGETEQGRRVEVELAAHGSSTGFTALKTASADLAASSRPIKDSELVSLQPLGDLKSAAAEQVIAIDGAGNHPASAKPVEHTRHRATGAHFQRRGENLGRARWQRRDHPSLCAR